jgi:predicted HTH transcriptional regulator
MHGSITNREAREITGVKDTNKMTRLFKKWMEQGLLEQQGSKRDSRYSKPGKKIKNLLSEGGDNKS